MNRWVNALWTCLTSQVTKKGETSWFLYCCAVEMSSQSLWAKAKKTMRAKHVWIPDDCSCCLWVTGAAEVHLPPQQRLPAATQTARGADLSLQPSCCFLPSACDYIFIHPQGSRDGQWTRIDLQKRQCNPYRIGLLIQTLINLLHHWKRWVRLISLILEPHVRV